MSSWMPMPVLLLLAVVVHHEVLLAGGATAASVTAFEGSQMLHRTRAEGLQSVEGGASSAPKAADADDVPDGSEPTWEAQFKWGLFHSKQVVDSKSASDWVTDELFSGAAVPKQVVHAEELLLAGADSAPTEKLQREKTAERALRMYYHAKWLAERNFPKAAEWRYRESAKLAKKCRRSVLAAHALSRLGYFLMHWNRRQEAREVLMESEQLSKKSNPLAPFLIGVLDREAPGSDAELRAAEDKILAASELPSQELNEDQMQLVKEIRYWRAAEAAPSMRQCLIGAGDIANVLICLIGRVLFQVPRR
jgi:hypothetical protein